MPRLAAAQCTTRHRSRPRQQCARQSLGQWPSEIHAHASARALSQDGPCPSRGREGKAPGLTPRRGPRCSELCRLPAPVSYSIYHQISGSALGYLSWGCLNVFGINTTVGVEHARPILLMCTNYCRLQEGSSMLDPYNEHHPETAYAPRGKLKKKFVLACVRLKESVCNNWCAY